MENNKIIFSLAGINHKTSTIDIREQYQFNRQEISNALTHFKAYDGVDSVIIISTCNRTEFYVAMYEGYNFKSMLSCFYKSFRNIDYEKDSESFYFLEGKEVTSHLFRVISGMDSLVLGEYQIQGQVKEAYSFACEAKTVEKPLHKLFHAAFRVGKKIRSQTTICEGRQSVSGMASQALIDFLNPMDNVLIIGVNENSKIFAQELIKHGFNHLIFTNRTAYKAEMMAHQYGGQSVPFEELENALSTAEGVFTSTAKQGFVVGTDMLKRLIARNACPSIFIDMAVPRDIDRSALNGNTKYYDIGDLKVFLEEQKKRQSEDMPKAEAIVQSETDIFEEWAINQNNNLLEPYAERFEIVRQSLLEENQKQFSEEAMMKVDRLTRSLVHRLQSTFVRILVKNEETD